METGQILAAEFTAFLIVLMGQSLASPNRVRKLAHLGRVEIDREYSG